MTKQEIASLRVIIKNLKDSAKTGWIDGDFQQWVAWAKIMRNTISTSSDLIEAIIDSTDLDELPKDNKPLTLD